MLLAVLFSSFAFVVNAQNLFSQGGTVGSSFGATSNPGVSIRSPFAWYPFHVWDGAVPNGSFWTHPYTGVGIDPGNNPNEIAQITTTKDVNSGLLLNAASWDSGRGTSGILLGTGDNATTQKTTLFARTFDFNFISYTDKLDKVALAGVGTGITQGTKVITIDDILGQGPSLRVLGGIKAKK